MRNRKAPLREKFLKNLDEIKRLYYIEGLSLHELGRIYQMSHSTIDNYLKELHLPKKKTSDWTRKYHCNYNYFETIDSPDKAYFLGWMYSDGYNYTKSKKQFIALELQEPDSYILSLFKKYLNSNHALFITKKKEPHHQNKVKLSLANKKISNDLVKVGCGQCKSLILEFPMEEQVPTHLLHHFIRGYIDGDGSIYAPTGKLHSTHLHLCASLEFSLKLQNLLLSKFNIHSKISQYSKIHSLRVCGRKQCLEILNWVYKDCGELKLERKYEKYLKIKNYKRDISKMTSQFTYIYRIKENNKFIARVENKNKSVHVGVFKYETQAALAANNHIIRNCFDKPLNIIPGLEFV